jgi:hypothetical protein
LNKGCLDGTQNATVWNCGGKEIAEHARWRSVGLKAAHVWWAPWRIQ